MSSNEEELMNRSEKRTYNQYVSTTCQTHLREGQSKGVVHPKTRRRWNSRLDSALSEGTIVMNIMFKVS